MGHVDGSKCPHPDNAFNNDFTVIDSDGIHEVSLNYCSCPQSPPKLVQLLRARLFPSTVIDPRTAATFRVLETFQMLTFTSKVSGYEYYRSLARRTDNTGISLPPVSIFFFLPAHCGTILCLCPGSVSFISPDCERMAPCPVTEDDGPRIRCYWCERYKRGAMCSPVSSMSYPRCQFACRLEGAPNFPAVSWDIFTQINLIAVLGGYILCSLGLMQTFA